MNNHVQKHQLVQKLSNLWDHLMSFEPSETDVSKKQNK
jgi:hypothetical protein